MKALKSSLAVFAIASAIVLPASASYAMSTISDSPNGTFSNGSLDGWQERSFDGNTEYELVEADGFSVLRGHTQATASVLYKEQTINLEDTPIIKWSWRVDETYDGLEEKTKAGDDFPARLYVVAQVGFLPWETLAINYVWGSDVEEGETWLNPFTDKAVMVAVKSGDGDLGKWTTHSRNVAEDFKNLFDQDIDELNGYAVMVDGDNSGQSGTAWFGEINFMSPSL